MFSIVADCKDKWHIIRGRYLRQLEEIQPSGSGVKPKKHYYLNDYLHFLKPFTISRIQTGNLTKNQEPINDIDDKSVDEEQQLDEDDDIECSEMSSTISIVNSKTLKSSLGHVTL